MQSCRLPRLAILAALFLSISARADLPAEEMSSEVPPEAVTAPPPPPDADLIDPKKSALDISPAPQPEAPLEPSDDTKILDALAKPDSSADPDPAPVEAPLVEEAQTSPAPDPLVDAAASEPQEVRKSVAEELPRRERGVLPHMRHRPNWGVQITGSTQAFGATDLSSSQGGNPTRAAVVELELQPAFLQFLGVIGFGISGGLFPISASAGVTKSAISIWEVGGQVRYQLRVFREQLIVPVVSYEWERVAYEFTDGTSGAALVSGPAFGGMLLLNLFEPTSAAELFVTHGISRTYLLAQLKSLKGSDGQFDVAGQSLFFGLRFEF